MENLTAKDIQTYPKVIRWKLWCICFINKEPSITETFYTRVKAFRDTFEDEFKKWNNSYVLYPICNLPELDWDKELDRRVAAKAFLQSKTHQEDLRRFMSKERVKNMEHIFRIFPLDAWES